MTAMALDPAGGGRDRAEIARRHGHWYAELISAKGVETADGSATAATVVKHRLDQAPIVVDVGGGYGGAVTLRFKDNDIKPMAFHGANRLERLLSRKSAAQATATNSTGRSPEIGPASFVTRARWASKASSPSAPARGV
jgi:hypothetical protein